MKNRIVIIDGNSLVNRAYYAIQKPMITKKGFYTQGIYGFLSMMNKIIKDYDPSHVLVAFDRKAPTFRHLKCASYKAGRKGMPQELAMEMPVLKDVLHALGYKTFEIDGYEADDIMGTTARMAEEEGLDALIITGDRDALQLASAKTSVIINKKGMTDFRLYDDNTMNEEYGFGHEQFIDYKALRGDTSDNIPGVPGIGETSALKLIRQFGSIDKLYENIGSIESASMRTKLENGKESAYFSKWLATIVKDVPVDYTLDDCRIKSPDKDRLIDLYSELEFKKYLQSLMNDSDTSADSIMTNESAPSASSMSYSISICEKPGSLGGKVIVELYSDDSHIAVPSLDALAVYSDEGCRLIFDLEEIKQFFINKELTLIGFNLQRVFYVLKMNGIDISRLTNGFDCALSAYLLNPGKNAQSLDEMIFEIFHEKLSGAKVQEQQMSFDFSGSEKYDDYEKRLRAVYSIMLIHQDELQKNDLDYVFYNIELPLSKVMASMECSGFAVNKQTLSDFGAMLSMRIADAEANIYELAGSRFNINSPKQLGEVLFDKLHLPAGKKTKSGYSTGADILEKLAQDFPIAAEIINYRTLTKLKSTYVDGLIPLIADDGKIHAHFQQTVTATGRISCTQPNLQNIPVKNELGRQLRRAFEADDGYVLIGADYSQIELRVMAHMSKDPALIQCFNDGLDIHTQTASKVFNVPFDSVTKEMRSNAKAVNFGVIYGMSGFGLASELTISKKEAEKYIQDYFLRFTDVKNFLDKSVDECKKNGYVRSLYGRKRDIPEISSPAYMVRQLGERLAMNTPIQGTAADIIKLAMIKVFDALQKKCPQAELIMQVHDELIVSAPEQYKELVADILREEMENAAALDVRLDTAMESGTDWYELK